MRGPDGEPRDEMPPWKRLAVKASDAIKTYPLAAVALGLGLGYLATRTVRR